MRRYDTSIARYEDAKTVLLARRLTDIIACAERVRFDVFGTLLPA